MRTLDLWFELNLYKTERGSTHTEVGEVLLAGEGGLDNALVPAALPWEDVVRLPAGMQERKAKACESPGKQAGRQQQQRFITH